MKANLIYIFLLIKYCLDFLNKLVIALFNGSVKKYIKITRSYLQICIGSRCFVPILFQFLMKFILILPKMRQRFENFCYFYPCTQTASYKVIGVLLGAVRTVASRTVVMNVKWASVFHEIFPLIHYNSEKYLCID